MKISDAKINKIIAKAGPKGIIKTREQAFIDFPVNEEKHKGDINYFFKERKTNEV